MDHCVSNEEIAGDAEFKGFTFRTGVVFFPFLMTEAICSSCGSDFDECSVYGTCSQSCTNTEGGYTCSCVEGYLSQPDNRSCKAKNGEYQKEARGLEQRSGAPGCVEKCGNLQNQFGGRVMGVLSPTVTRLNPSPGG